MKALSNITTPDITVSDIIEIMNAEQPGSAIAISTGEKTYEIADIKQNGVSITEPVEIANNGSVTLNVEIRESAEGYKYYGIVNGKYYEIKLTGETITVENGKTYQEVQAGGTSGTPTLSAVVENQSGDTANVTITSNNDQKTITLADNGAGTGRIKSTYTLNSKRDQKTRSKTFPGIARAMAEQWGAVRIADCPGGWSKASEIFGQVTLFDY